MICDWNSTQNVISQILLEPGYYRIHDNSVDVLKCDSRLGCRGSVASGVDLCATGYYGPMCQLCLVNDNTTYTMDGGECMLCNTRHKITVYVLVAVLPLLVIGAYAYMKKNGSKPTKIEKQPSEKKMLKNIQKQPSLMGKSLSRVSSILGRLTCVFIFRSLSSIVYRSVVCLTVCLPSWLCTCLFICLTVCLPSLPASSV
jgi:hypothetical protein